MPTDSDLERIVLWTQVITGINLMPAVFSLYSMAPPGSGAANVFRNWAARPLGIMEADHCGQPPARRGKAPSTWVIMARRRDDFGQLANHILWRPLISRPGTTLWTDDYSNIFQALHRN
jgi:hypothetical protein